MFLFTICQKAQISSLVSISEHHGLQHLTGLEIFASLEVLPFCLSLHLFLLFKVSYAAHG